MAPTSKADRKAALDVTAWMFNVVTSVGIIMVNKALMATHSFSFVSCLLEVVFDKIHYSRATKLSIVVVLVGVAICTVTDVSVNAKGLMAAIIAVWSTSLQQYVSKQLHI
ncbi:hypothetical protein BHE74_00027836 [Ensete ventricosum]|nr:hypothetical protein BHE74_00027836 [Ensete ventricosum]